MSQNTLSFGMRQTVIDTETKYAFRGVAKVKVVWETFTVKFWAIEIVRCI